MGEVPDVWVPVTTLPRIMVGTNWLDGKNNNFLDIIGRLKPEVSTARAAEALSLLRIQIDLRAPPTLAIKFGLEFCLRTWRPPGSPDTGRLPGSDPGRPLSKWPSAHNCLERFWKTGYGGQCVMISGLNSRRQQSQAKRSRQFDQLCGIGGRRTFRHGQEIFL